MIRFPYRAFRHVSIAPQLVPRGALPIRYRPVVPVRVFAAHAPAAGVLVGDAFADPGSDLTILQQGFSRTLGIASFVHQMNHRWKGVSYPVRFAPVRLELFDGTTSLNWPATVGFTSAPIPYGCLLGLSGFFEFFDVRFLGWQRLLEVEPNDLFQKVLAS